MPHITQEEAVVVTAHGEHGTYHMGHAEHFDEEAMAEFGQSEQAEVDKKFAKMIGANSIQGVEEPAIRQGNSVRDRIDDDFYYDKDVSGHPAKPSKFKK